MIDLSNRLEPYIGEIGSICTKTGVNDEDRTTDDTISRQAAIDIVRNRVKRFTTACVLAVTDIEKLPPAHPERKRGRWLPDNDCYYETRYICSKCKLPFHVETIMMKPSWRFCPNCGARMDGESE